MGRALGQECTPYRRRGLDAASVIGEFNAAAASRARLSRLIFDLAGYAADRACSREQNALVELDRALGLRPGFAKELKKPLREYAQLELHTQLHRFLDEGRRLVVSELESMASQAVRTAAVGLWSERSSELAESLDLASAEALSGGAWEEALRGVFSQEDPRAYLHSQMQHLLERKLVERELAVAA